MFSLAREGNEMQHEEQDNGSSKGPDHAAPSDAVLKMAARIARDVERWTRITEDMRKAMTIPSGVATYAEEISKTVEVARKALGLMAEQPIPLLKLPRMAELFPVPKLPKFPPLPTFPRIEPPSAAIAELLDDLATHPYPPSHDLSEEDVEWVKRRGMPEPDHGEQEDEDYRPGTYL